MTLNELLNSFGKGLLLSFIVTLILRFMIEFFKIGNNSQGLLKQSNLLKAAAVVAGLITFLLLRGEF